MAMAAQKPAVLCGEVMLVDNARTVNFFAANFMVPGTVIPVSITGFRCDDRGAKCGWRVRFSVMVVFENGLKDLQNLLKILKPINTKLGKFRKLIENGYTFYEVEYLVKVESNTCNHQHQSFCKYDNDANAYRAINGM